MEHDFSSHWNVTMALCPMIGREAKSKPENKRRSYGYSDSLGRIHHGRSHEESD